MLIRRERSTAGTSGPSNPGSASLLGIHVLAPAKINLYLEVLGKRPDGYHAIETVMLAVELYDEIAIAASAADEIGLTCDNPELTVGPNNLVLKAARLLKERTGCPQGAVIRLTKRIPWSAGLGGGSSDAAAALAGLNEFWQLGLRTAELVALAAELGSDVPFFFHTPAAVCTGRGELVEPLQVGRTFDLVLIKPPCGLNTAEVYQALRKDDSEIPNSVFRVPQSCKDALASGNVEQLAASLHNRLQEPAMKIAPPVAELYRRLQQTGAAGGLMTGSGSCLFALCHDERKARQVAHDLLSGWPTTQELAGTRVFYVRSCR